MNQYKNNTRKFSTLIGSVSAMTQNSECNGAPKREDCVLCAYIRLMQIIIKVYFMYLSYFYKFFKFGKMPKRFYTTQPS